MIAQLAILLEREVRDLDAELFGFGYRSSRDVMGLSERNLMSDLSTRNTAYSFSNQVVGEISG
jgi:hypothetical protein